MAAYDLNIGQKISDTVLVDGDFRVDTTLPDGAFLRLVLILLPGCRADVDIDVKLGGKLSRLEIYGASFAVTGDDFRIRTRVEHSVPVSSSDQLFKNIASGSARLGFDGRIKVSDGAVQTEAFQQCHSLLLSDEAVVTTGPELEIYADDVKCSHGATVGRLNEDELFYMRSRGIDHPRAKALLEKAFLLETVEKIEDGEYREKVEAALEEAFEKYPVL